MRKIEASVTTMAALCAKIVSELKLSAEPEQLRLEYLDADEYLDLKSCDELPTRCKVRASLKADQVTTAEVENTAEIEVEAEGKRRAEAEPATEKDLLSCARAMWHLHMTREEEEAKRRAETDAQAQVALEAQAALEQLSKLVVAHDDGILTDAEFAAKAKALLAQRVEPQTVLEKLIVSQKLAVAHNDGILTDTEFTSTAKALLLFE